VNQTIVEKLIAARLSHEGRRKPPDPDFARLWPSIYELITTELRQGHRIHEPADLRFRGGDGEWVVTLSVGYLAQSTTATGPTHLEALTALESLLSTGIARWSTWKGKKPQIDAPDRDQGERGTPSKNGRSKKAKK
jgi:hypothetical protein